MLRTKDAIIGSLVLLVVAAGLIWYVWGQPVTIVGPSDNTEVPGGSTAPVISQDSTEYYDIEFTHPGRTPLFESAGASADAQAIALMRAWEEATAETFRQEGGFDRLTPEDITMMGYDQGRKQALKIDYRLFMGEDTVSYEYTVFADTFGAHPNVYLRTFTFDARTGEELALADIFDGKTAYIEELSRKSRELLVPQVASMSEIPVAELDTAYIESGTEAKAENFQWFYFDEDAFVLVFPPYQVGPWALGRQEARLPKSELSAFLRAEYQ